MKILVKIYKSARQYWGFIAISALIMLGLTGLNLITPRLTQNMVGILESFDAGKNIETELSAIINIAIILFFVFLFRSIMQFLQSYISHYAAWRFVGELRARIYSHLQQLSISYYHDKQTGQLMSRVINDTNAFETLIAHAIPDLASSIILFIGVTIILFTTNPILAALTCIPIPFILLTAPLIKKIREMHKQAQVLVADLNSKLQDNFSGIKEIQIFNREDDEYASVTDKAAKHAQALIKALFYSAVIHPSIAFLTSLGNVIVIGVGGYLVLYPQFDMRISDIVGFLLYLSMFYGPVSSFARIIEDMQAGIAGGERVFEVLDATADVEEKQNAEEISGVMGNIKFNNVSFRYNENELILNDVSFEVPAKKMFALVGPTGVGKTTLAALIPRFYDVTEGSILIDGHNLKDLTLKSLRDNISMVLQDVFLFNGTIRENITYGKPDAKDEEIINAAKMACIHEFADSLPQKYETVVGERGVRLSGGQKQRIAIARALLCGSPVLILDEATSSVDTETEREIQEAIQKIAGSCTLIVIAHRLSTVKRADSILVLEDGEVKEQGTHDELIAENGAYKKLVDMQNIKN